MSRSAIALLCGVSLLMLAAWLSGRTIWSTPPNALVVYCAHDAEYSEPLLREFERRTGIPVFIQFDTEATKSLGLINILVHEKSRPRCDVFWNNELLGMLDLQAQGVLEPYRGSGFERIPERYKDPAGHWTGFAARLRVHIVNTAETQAGAAAVDQLWQADNLDRLAIAKPLYGTTLTHYAVLAELWGLERLKAWHRDCRQRGLREVNGNATVKNMVALGVCQAGLTDTDDYFVAHDARQPVAMLPVRVGAQQTICIPNCVGIIRGTRHKQTAQQLVDFLLSAESELKLARSPARQVPLGPVNLKDLPPEVRELAAWAQEGVDLRRLAAARGACVAWLTEEYLNRRPLPAKSAASAAGANVP